MNNTFQLTARIRSFKFAFRGIWFLFQTQHNTWIHALAAILVIILGLFFHISASEWCCLILVITLVLTTEALNSAIEFLGDAVTLETNSLIGKAKDIAAGAVLITAIGAVIIGCIIFYPYIKTFLFR